ncbi:2639_t:CDS:2 [Ambispora leptoticha]|uniref:2639_t:CDS:1 n=1 Tax=Ambispora leptoticha TaxID=144679 RepID=A0A9N9A1C0_9GLOM|nr:2639_t:CDS:2 [Ambispora leptoticha]
MDSSKGNISRMRQTYRQPRSQQPLTSLDRELDRAERRTQALSNLAQEMERTEKLLPTVYIPQNKTESKTKTTSNLRREKDNKLEGMSLGSELYRAERKTQQLRKVSLDGNESININNTTRLRLPSQRKTHKELPFDENAAQETIFEFANKPSSYMFDKSENRAENINLEFNQVKSTSRVSLGKKDTRLSSQNLKIKGDDDPTLTPKRRTTTRKSSRSGTPSKHRTPSKVKSPKVRTPLIDKSNTQFSYINENDDSEIKNSSHHLDNIMERYKKSSAIDETREYSKLTPNSKPIVTENSGTPNLQFEDTPLTSFLAKESPLFKNIDSSDLASLITPKQDEGSEDSNSTIKASSTRTSGAASVEYTPTPQFLTKESPVSEFTPSVLSDKIQELDEIVETPPTVKGEIIPFFPLNPSTTPSKRMRVDDERDYYQKRLRQLEEEVQEAKHAANHYKQLLHGPIYLNDAKSIRKLMSRIGKYKSAHVKAQLAKDEGDADGLPDNVEIIYLWLERNGYLDQYMLPEFRAIEAVATMELTSTFERISENIREKLTAENSDTNTSKEFENRKIQNVCAILSIFSQPNSFQSLKWLKLSDMPISDPYLIHLHSLQSLEQLYLDNTSISDEGIANLVALKNSLKQLDLANNIHITDRSFYILRYFEVLEQLALEGTSITMYGLRTFVRESRSKNLHQLTVPQECRDYLNHRHLLYCIAPKQQKNPNRIPFIIDPRRVALLSTATLKLQLTFHYEVNPNICITGEKAELADRLREILERRRDDGKVLQLVGGRDF